MPTSKFAHLQSLCEGRTSCRHFAGREVSPDDIGKILHLANSSPYAAGLKNREIQVVTSRESIVAMADAVRGKALEMSLGIRDNLRDGFANYSKSFTFFEDAPVVLLFTFRVAPMITSMMGNAMTDELRQFERDTFTKSISCVAMIALLAAESLGLGACYMTGPLIAQAEIMKIAGSKPGRELGALIPIGHKLEIP